jgi:DNA polymerase-3 subunit beta
MKLTCSTEQLAAAIQQVKGAAAKKSTMPILASLHLQAMESGRLHLTGFDLDTGIIAEIPAEVQTPGAVCLPAGVLADLVPKLPDARVSLEPVMEGYMAVESGPAKFKLASLAADQYPPMHQAHGDMATVDAAALAGLLGRVAHAMSVDETRATLNGVYLHTPKDGPALAVATDGHRMAIAQAELPGLVVGGKKREAILARPGVVQLQRLLDGGGEVQMGVGTSLAQAARADRSLIFRLIDGAFPEFQQVVPKAWSTRAQVDRETLAGALKRISLLSSEKASAVRVEVGPEGLRFGARNPELGEAAEGVPAEVEGKALVVGCNARYLLDALGACGEDRVALEFVDDSNPIVVRPLEGDAFRAVVMPLRLQN